MPARRVNEIVVVAPDRLDPRYLELIEPIRAVLTDPLQPASAKVQAARLLLDEFKITDSSVKPCEVCSQRATLERSYDTPEFQASVAANVLIAGGAGHLNLQEVTALRSALTRVHGPVNLSPAEQQQIAEDAEAEVFRSDAENSQALDVDFTVMLDNPWAFLDSTCARCTHLILQHASGLECSGPKCNCQRFETAKTGAAEHASSERLRR